MPCGGCFRRELNKIGHYWTSMPKDLRGALTLNFNTIACNFTQTDWPSCTLDADFS
jgi:hypothetical protein